MEEACEPETKQGKTYRVLVDRKALSRSIEESTEPRHTMQRYHAASVLRKAAASTDHVLKVGPFDQKKYSGKPRGRRYEQQSGLQTLRRVHRERKHVGSALTTCPCTRIPTRSIYACGL